MNTQIHRDSIINTTPRFKSLMELPLRIHSFSHGLVLAAFLALFLSTSPAQAATDNDPLEGFNRASHGFNQLLDSLLIRPLATAYGKVTPRFAKRGVSNFFNNLDDVRVGVNDLLQLKFRHAGNDFGRVLINSSLGLGGLFDVADSSFNLEKHYEDFGQTLALWDIESGPYIVLPFFGPSTVRDSFGLVVDTLLSPIPKVDHVSTRNSLIATKTAESRLSFVAFEDLINGDEYLFMRSAYQQYRNYEIQDGNLLISFEEF